MTQLKSIQKIDTADSVCSKFKKPFFQPKLTINQPNEVYEQEADAMADKVMRMSDASLNSNSFFEPSVMPVQCKHAHYRKEENLRRKEAGIIQRQEPSNDAPAPSPNFTLPTPSLLQPTREPDYLSMRQPFINRNIFNLWDPDSASQVWQYNFNFFTRFGISADLSTTLTNITAPRFIDAQLKANNPTWWEITDQQLNTTTIGASIPVLDFNADFSPQAPSWLKTILGSSNKNVQRKCAHCEEEKMHRKETNADVTTADASTENYISSLNGKGRSLTQNERSFFEPRFGYDFSNVQLHTNSEANKSAKNINALAYTHGNNIVFGDNQYQPDTEHGKKLIAHELTHVVQQNSLVQKKHIQRVSWEGFESEALCRTHSDEGVYEFIRDHYFSDQPNAKAHIIHYRINGGINYKEDVKALFDANPRVRTRISTLIVIQGGVAKGVTSGVLIGKGADDGKEPPIRQSDYDSEDWRNSNGNVDEVRWKLVGAFNPKGDNTYEITIVDPYTWHSGEDRPTQCIHAAMERLKASGAADYITMGTANVVLPLPVASAGKDDSL